MLVEGGWTLPATGDKRRVSDRVTVPKAKTLGPATVPLPQDHAKQRRFVLRGQRPHSRPLVRRWPMLSPDNRICSEQVRRSSFPPAQRPPRPNHRGSLLAARSGSVAKMKSAATLGLIPAAGAHLLLGLVHAASARPPAHVC